METTSKTQQAHQLPPRDFWEDQYRSLGLAQRIDKISACFLGSPYLLSPLGEREAERFRFDCFDCITYVETVLALSLSKDFDRFKKLIDIIRYKDGDINFLKQNHIHMTADWIPNSISLGICHDITEEVAEKTGFQIYDAETFSDRKGYFEKRFNDKLEADKGKTFLEGEESGCGYLSHLDFLTEPQKLETLETGTILSIVRPNWDRKKDLGSNFNISHIGFVIKKDDNKVYFRHATSIGSMNVTELPLIEYLKKYAELEKTTVRGIHLLKPISQK